MSQNPAEGETQSVARDTDPRRIAQRFVEQQREAQPVQIGPYRILQTLGEGGMGVVYLAEQEKPIHRRVALKIIKLGMDTKQVVARFDTEREALALMNHPNVAKVFDAGATEQGRPYFAMEYVPGIPITAYCDKHRLTTKERLNLFMDVCHAVQHAHQKGIIHRDIKPGNVLVAVQDEKPIPKIIDFGVAKATQHRLTERTLFTEQGQLIGTPGYMSPEQAEMTALDIDTRTDIYSLGVLLYELLVGARPFDDEVLRQAAFAEIQRIIREVDPPKPSTRLSALRSVPRVLTSGPATPADAKSPLPHPGHAAGREAATGGRTSARRVQGGSDYDRRSIQEIAKLRHTEPATLIHQIRGDLDWIVMKCLEKDRTRRYETANALAMDIERYLRHEPVLAGPPSASYKVRKFVRRNRAAVLVSALFFAVVAGAAVGMTGLYVRAENQRREAEHARSAEAEQRQIAQANQSLAERALAEKLQALDRAEKGESRAQQERIRAEQEAALATQITEFLVGLFRVSDPNEARGSSVTAREILDRGARQIRTELQRQPATRAALLHTIGVVYKELGLYDAAAELLTDALRIRRAEFGDSHSDVHETMRALFYVTQSAGDYDEAGRIGRQLLDGLVKAHGPDHPEVGFVRADLARIEHSKVGPVKAEKQAMGATLMFVLTFIRPEDYDPDLAQIILEIREINTTQGTDAATRVLTDYWHEIQMKLRRQVLSGNAEDARAEIQRHYRPFLDGAVFRSRIGPTLGAIGLMLIERGDFALAEVFLAEALSVERIVGRAGGPGEALAINNLASCVAYNGRIREAEQLERECVAMQRRLYENAHPDLARSLINLGGMLLDNGAIEEAEQVLNEAVAALRTLPSASPECLAHGLQTLARVLRERGDCDGAEELVTESLDLLCQHLGDDRKEVTSGRYHLALVRECQGRFDEAEQLHLQAVEEYRKNLGPDNAYVGIVLDRLGRLAERKEEYDNAVALYRQALRVMQGTTMPGNATCGPLMVRLARALAGRGAYAESEVYAREALNALQRRPVPDDSELGEALSVLGGSLAGLERFAEAEQHALAGYSKLTKNAATPATRVQAALDRITKIYGLWDAAEPGKGYDAKAAEWRAKLEAAKATEPRSDGATEGPTERMKDEGGRMKDGP